MGPEDLTTILKKIPKLKDECLLVGFETGDDAAVFQLTSDLAVVQSLDFFMPIVDDPFVFGQIAAANAISDIYAMGAKPIMALAILGFPVKKLSPEVASEIMAGGYDVCRKAGIQIAGGHSIDDSEPKFGLSVTGVVHPQQIWSNASAKVGDKLILTKPLGVGALGQGIKKGILTDEAYAAFVETTTFLNAAPAKAAQAIGVHAATDITGFGLLGHALEMAQGSGVKLQLEMEKIPVVTQAWELLEQSIKPGATARNLNHVDQSVQYAPHISQAQRFLLADPQTSGGLLFAVAPEKAEDLSLAILKEGALTAEIIGTVCEGYGLDVI